MTKRSLMRTTAKSNSLIIDDVLLGGSKTNKYQRRKLCHMLDLQRITNSLEEVLVNMFVTVFLVAFSSAFGSRLPLVVKRSPPELAYLDKRLPTDLVPFHYDLEIKPYLLPRDLTFEGHVRILLSCFEETDRIVFHSKGLTFGVQNVTLSTVEDGANVKVNALQFDTSNDFVVIQIDENLMPGRRYELGVRYHGKLDYKGCGFYVSTYYDFTEGERFVASTQFETTCARRAFPCFDEPIFKATFRIVIVRWKNMTSLSNMPKERVSERGKDWEADEYLSSPQMPTYLVAFVIGDYDNNTLGKLTIWSPRGIDIQSDFALQFSAKTLNFFENVLSTKYYLPKFDIALVPFLIFGGMENFGLVTFPIHHFKYSKEEIQTLANLLAHEISHQWFGNLVTMKWWSDIWLNEGFATYMQWISVDHFFPEWNEVDISVLTASKLFMEECCSNYRGDFFSTKCKNDARNPKILWNSNASNADVLDQLQYYKGAMMVRMVHHILGNETFWRFLSKYLNENAYGNVDENEFWRYVEAELNETENSKINMAGMTSWTHLPGMPIVTVTRWNNGVHAIVSQKSCINSAERSSDLWHIPVSYVTKTNFPKKSNISEWLTGRETALCNITSGDEWILLNEEVADYYIVDYDRKNWQLLADQLKQDHTVFTAKQRYKIMSDAHHLFMTEDTHVTVDVLLELCSYLHKEKIWSVFEKPNYEFLMNAFPLMATTPLRKEWKEYVGYVLGPFYDTFHDKGTGKIPMGSLKAGLCSVHYKTCVEKYMALFDQWKNESSKGSLYWHEIKEALCEAVSGNSTNSKYVYNVYLKEKDNSYLDALFCSSDPTVIDSLLKEFDKDRTSDLLYYGKRLAKNPWHWTKLLSYIDKHFEKLAKESFWLMDNLLEEFSSPASIEKVLEITKKHIPNLTEELKTKVRKYIHEPKESFLTKIKPIARGIEEWLKRKPWTVQS